MSYQLLQEAARKRTEFLVVEAGVDTEGTFKAELPQELIDLLSNFVGGEGAEDQVSLIAYYPRFCGSSTISQIALATSSRGCLRSTCSRMPR